MDMLKGINLGLSFLLEIVMLVGFGYWGFHTDTSSTVQWILGVGVPVIAIVIWSIFNAPLSKRRLSRTPRTILEVVMFGLGALAFFVSGQTRLAAIFVVLIVINQILLYVWQQ